MFFFRLKGATAPITTATPPNGAAIRRFVPGSNIKPDPKWYIGLDLGQRRDHTALAAVLLTWNHRGQCPLTYAQKYQPELHLHHIERWPLGTTYESFPNILTQRLRQFDRIRLAGQKTLSLDAGGPGPPVVENLRRLREQNLTIRPVIITGGKTVSKLDNGYKGVPRSILVSTLLLTISAGSLQYCATNPGLDLFESEILDLNGETGHPNSANAHDDTVLAVALAVQAATTETPQLLPGAGDDNGETRFGYINKPLF